MEVQIIILFLKKNQFLHLHSVVLRNHALSHLCTMLIVMYHCNWSQRTPCQSSRHAAYYAMNRTTQYFKEWLQLVSWSRRLKICLCHLWRERLKPFYCTNHLTGTLRALPCQMLSTWCYMVPLNETGCDFCWSLRDRWDFFCFPLFSMKIVNCLLSAQTFIENSKSCIRTAYILAIKSGDPKWVPPITFPLILKQFYLV